MSKTQDQQDLIDFVTDPETIKKAAEGSMEKRQAVFDSHNPTELSDELEHKVLLLFQKMSVCAATHQGNKDEWIDGQCVTPTTAAKEMLKLIETETREAYKKGYIDGGISELKATLSNHVSKEE